MRAVYSSRRARIGKAPVAPAVAVVLAAGGLTLLANGDMSRHREARMLQGCAQTLIGTGEYRLVPGLDFMPSAPDAANAAGCSFEDAVTSVTVVLRWDPNEVAWTHHFEEPVSQFGLPLPEGTLGRIPADLPLGRYEREVRLVHESGEVTTVWNDVVHLVLDRQLSGRECSALREQEGPLADCTSLRGVHGVSD